MKKIKLLSVLSAVLILSACGDTTASTHSMDNNQQNSVTAVLESRMEEADAQAQDPASVITDPALADNGLFGSGEFDPTQGGMISPSAPAPEDVGDISALAGSTEGVDVDLTVLSATMVYSQVFNMVYNPDEYIGKTIKMDGMYATYQDPDTGVFYCACIIEDATACCQQGIEFVLTDDYTYPDDYPEYGDDVVVVGTFDTYKEGGYIYCTLRNATLLDPGMP